MKKIFKNIAVHILTLSMLAGGAYSTAAAGVLSFSDVPQTYWGYQTIMDMTEHGLFKGTSDPLNGIGTFSPEKVMTRAEFITAALRAVYPYEASEIETKGERWWRGFYILALDKNILCSTELDTGDLNQPMSREEMAMVMVRCVENNGEDLSQRVLSSQIADYWLIDAYYKEYVRDCFSYGLLCGVDSKGTFAPTKSLTRAEAATVLCRLVNEEMRIAVDFEEESEEEEKQWDSYTDEKDEQEEYRDNFRDEVEKEDDAKEQEKQENALTEPERPEFEGREPLPWENGGKQPPKYTWAEYSALTSAQQQAFFESFEDAEDFRKWMDRVQNQETADDLPWEVGGKQPKDYKWSEYNALTPAQQEAFFESFGDTESFNAWLESARQNDTTDDLPWESGGKQPEDYTWEEYKELTHKQQEAFFESFGSAEDFVAWMDRVQGQKTADDLPWENGGKQPEDYTWDEYKALTSAQQEAFFESFGDPADFTEWIRTAQGKTTEEYLPWENGGKQPKDYTWDEYKELTYEQQKAFCESFKNPDDFIAWMDKSQ